jgi:hypothetical protein
MRCKIALVVGVVACGCAEGGAGDERLDAPPRSAPSSEPAADGHSHALDVDWVRFSEEEIHRSAAAVVRGRVVEQWSGSHRTYPTDPATGRELSDEEAGGRFAELPLLTSVVEVDQRLDLRDGRPPPSLRVRVEVVQLGGRYPDGCWVEPSDQKLLRIDDDVVVFLKPAGMVPRERKAPTTAFSIVGGQQGLVPLRDGVVDPIPTTVFARYAGQPVVELARDVEQFALSAGGR